jgi:hypothetical protein
VLMDTPDLQGTLHAFHRVLKTDGMAVLVFSHPCFPQGPDFSDPWFEQAFMDISGQCLMKVLYPQGIMNTHPAGQGHLQREHPFPGTSAMPSYHDASVSR